MGIGLTSILLSVLNWHNHPVWKQLIQRHVKTCYFAMFHEEQGKFWPYIAKKVIPFYRHIVDWVNIGVWKKRNILCRQGCQHTSVFCKYGLWPQVFPSEDLSLCFPTVCGITLGLASSRCVYILISIVWLKPVVQCVLSKM